MGALEFARRQFTPKLDAQAFEKAAVNTAIGAEGVMFYPYLSGARAPFWPSRFTRRNAWADARAYGQPYGAGRL